MGGNAFKIPAQRLTTAKHTELLDYCKIKLHPFFPKGINVCRYVSTKVTHGDLDLCVAYEGISHDPIKGLEEGGEGGCGLAAVAEGKKGKPTEWRKVCDEVSEALGAIYWIRAGGEWMFAVPCSVINGGEGFYEIDLFLAPPDGLDFATMSMSYSTTPHLLSLLARSYTNSITIHLSDMILRHQPYPGVTGIDVHLTSSPVEFCNWLGLDYEHWDRTQFETMLDLWKWVAGIKEGSIGVGAMKKLSRRRGDSAQEVLKSRKWWNRQEGITDFLTWIRSEQSPWYQPDKPIENKDSTPSSRVEGSSSKVFLDPTKPIPLDVRAIAALNHFGKVEEYNKILGERRVRAEELYKSQHRKPAIKDTKADDNCDTEGIVDAVKTVTV